MEKRQGRALARSQNKQVVVGCWIDFPYLPDLVAHTCRYTNFDLEVLQLIYESTSVEEEY